MDPEGAKARPMNQNETAVEIVREAILQGLSIATTVASELRGFGLDDVEREWALEFTLAKAAVLSVRAEGLTDAALKTALVREIELFVNRRATLDPTIHFGFESYGRIVRENAVPSVEFAHAMGSLFRQRLDKTLLALPTAAMIRPTDNERLVSSSIAADYCWPLENPTEASVFGTPTEVEPSP